MPRADVAEIVDDALDGKRTIGNDQIAQQVFDGRSIVRFAVSFVFVAVSFVFVAVSFVIDVILFVISRA